MDKTTLLTVFHMPAETVLHLVIDRFDLCVFYHAVYKLLSTPIAIFICPPPFPYIHPPYTCCVLLCAILYNVHSGNYIVQIETPETATLSCMIMMILLLFFGGLLLLLCPVL
jgi:hypothetical protein